MSTKELRDRASKAIEGLSDRALLQLIELLEDLRVASIDNDEERIEQIIEENRNVLLRLAK